jgi:alpha-glucosidase (family GH31 glycosyl hydrolase)
MDVVISNTNGDPSITWKLVGGVVDVFIVAGPSPEAVITQYLSIIGRPYLPPLSMFGFNQCRYGFTSVDAVEDVLDAFIEKKIPLDTIWIDIGSPTFYIYFFYSQSLTNPTYLNNINDSIVCVHVFLLYSLDYMDKYKIFTTDPSKFPQSKMRHLAKKAHLANINLVLIVDPGVFAATYKESYSTFTDGNNNGVFIKNPGGIDNAKGKVWPTITVFPDFASSNAIEWWTSEIQKFQDQVSFDGLWIDMNEIESFCDGSCNMDENVEMSRNGDNSEGGWTLFSCECKTRSKSKYNDPPYLPGR